jgi:hypothetical protein
MAGLIVRQNMTDIMINDNVNSLAHNVKYKKPANINDVPLVKQEISCGYACIEMLSEYLDLEGNGALTEELIYKNNNNKITTSTNNGLYAELKKQFSDYKVTQYKNLRNSELLDRMYESVSNGMPVIFSFAALELDETGNSADGLQKWTLHYGVVSGMNLFGDQITVNNPYGYIETYSINDFLRATRFESYEEMEFYLKLGFASGMFSKNTIYIIEEKTIYTIDEEIATSEMIENTEITE